MIKVSPKYLNFENISKKCIHVLWPVKQIQIKRKIIAQLITKAFTRRYSVKKVFLEKFHKIQKETLAQVFSCEFCKISNNTLSYRTPPVATSLIRLVEVVQISVLFELSPKKTML